MIDGEMTGSIDDGQRERGETRDIDTRQMMDTEMTDSGGRRERKRDRDQRHRY